MQDLHLHNANDKILANFALQCTQKIKEEYIIVFIKRRLNTYLKTENRKNIFFSNLTVRQRKWMSDKKI